MRHLILLRGINVGGKNKLPMAELRAALEGLGADPAHRHIAFLAGRPDPAAVRGLDPGRSPGDEYAVIGREVFLHLPRGVARTKLTNAWLDRQLGTTSTVRNWKTVQRLLGMLTPGETT